MIPSISNAGDKISLLLVVDRLSVMLVAIIHNSHWLTRRWETCSSAPGSWHWQGDLPHWRRRTQPLPRSPGSCAPKSSGLIIEWSQFWFWKQVTLSFVVSIVRWRTNPGWARCLQGQTWCYRQLGSFGCHIVKQIIFDNDFKSLALINVCFKL